MKSRIQPHPQPHPHKHTTSTLLDVPMTGLSLKPRRRSIRVAAVANPVSVVSNQLLRKELSSTMIKNDIIRLTKYRNKIDEELQYNKRRLSDIEKVLLHTYDPEAKKILQNKRSDKMDDIDELHDHRNRIDKKINELNSKKNANKVLFGRKKSKNSKKHKTNKKLSRRRSFSNLM